MPVQNQRARLPSTCHCEPVRTLARQSVSPCSVPISHLSRKRERIATSHGFLAMTEEWGTALLAMTGTGGRIATLRCFFARTAQKQRISFNSPPPWRRSAWSSSPPGPGTAGSAARRSSCPSTHLLLVDLPRFSDMIDPYDQFSFCILEEGMLCQNALPRISFFRMFFRT